MQTKPLSPSSQAIFDIAKSANDAYLVAYRTGYEAGFSAALLQATKMVTQITETKIRQAWHCGECNHLNESKDEFCFECGESEANRSIKP